MGASMSQYTTTLANAMCGGSSRKLIAGWWYSILAVTTVLTLMSFVILSTRSIAEGFTAFWSALMLLILGIGGTMIMRKFHNSLAVGFFMGGVVAMAQLFFLLSLLYIGFGKEQTLRKLSAKKETLMALFSMMECILLGSFAAILGAHRSEILDKNTDTSLEQISIDYSEHDENAPRASSRYEPPSAKA